MEHATGIPLSTDSEVLAALEQQPSAPLLLNFTARWCQPCQAFAPVLAAARQAGAGRFELMKVDVDAYPELARRFGVRGVPATLLFLEGAEHDRLVGAKPLKAFCEWLTARQVPVAPPQDTDAVPPSASAFYADPELMQFLLDRLYRHMDKQEVRGQFMPWWQDGRGSVSAALVHSSSPEVFERVTGLPYGLACVLEFLLLESRHDTAPLFEALRPGADTREVPLRFAHALLGHASLRWAEALDSAPHDALRRDWLDAAGRMLGGQPVGAEHWTALRKAAQALVTDSDPHHMLEDDLATLVARMSPPPSAFDADEWRSILARYRFSRHRLFEVQAGWTKQDAAQHNLRHRFFKQHVPIDADGRFDTDLFAAKRAEWERDHADFLALERKFHEDYPARSEAFAALFLPVLADTLRGCAAA
jgi:thioredoxin 1